MGLSWSSSRTVKNNTLLLVTSPLPSNKVEQDQIWNLWKIHKDALKKEGFSISRDKFQGKWSVTYFHTINDDTYEKTTNGLHMWDVEFRKKISKWAKVAKKINQTVPEEEEPTERSKKKPIERPRKREYREVEDVPSQDFGTVHELNEEEDLAELQSLLNNAL